MCPYASVSERWENHANCSGVSAAWTIPRCWPGLDQPRVWPETTQRSDGNDSLPFAESEGPIEHRLVSAIRRAGTSLVYAGTSSALPTETHLQKSRRPGVFCPPQHRGRHSAGAQHRQSRIEMLLNIDHISGSLMVFHSAGRGAVRRLSQTAVASVSHIRGCMCSNHSPDTRELE